MCARKAGINQGQCPGERVAVLRGMLGRETPAATDVESA
jgi:hypothetical protein